MLVSRAASWARRMATATPPTTFAGAGVPPRLAAAVAGAFGIRSPTATQATALPAITAGRDVLLKAETGSGKTLTYLLPALARILQSVDRAAGNEVVAGAPSGDEAGERWAEVVIAVPTQELVVQVAAVARRLLPPAMAPLVVEAYGSRGASSRTPVAILIGTPAALRDNVNRKHVARACMVVLDEIDALLSGSFAETTKQTLLAPFRAVPPEHRPQHVFVGATVPAKGTASVAAFLDEHYPPSSMERIETARSHRLARPGVAYAFWQIDEGLPLTANEREADERQRGRLAAAVAAAVGSEPRLAAPPPADADLPAGDALATTMDARRREDEIAARREQEAAHVARLDEYRRIALLQALRAAIPATAAAVAHDHTAIHPWRMPRGETASAALDEAAVAAVPPTLVFAASGDRADTLRKYLLSASRGRLSVGVLHKRASEEERAKVVAQFLRGDVRVMVCTDIAARGIDTTHVRHVIQADFASDVIAFLHRAGRTGRAMPPGGAAPTASEAVPAPSKAGRGRAVRRLQAASDAAGDDGDHDVAAAEVEWSVGQVTSLVTRAALPLAQAIVHSIVSGEPVDAAVSRGRSFRKALKRAAKAAAEDQAVTAALAEIDRSGSSAAAPNPMIR